jgi:signal recognition particle receptor subunit beta
LALINHRTREIHFKIVYFGCGLCGKTTNLKALHDRLAPERRGKLISIATDHERTLFFDFLPIDLGQVNGFLTRFHLYTVPGQVYYRLSRRAVLQGVDGLVFVADSHPSREAANRESLADLHDHLRTIGITGPALARIPWVMQYNKRDLPLAIPVSRLRADLNERNWPEFEAVANDGRGVSETLRSICKAVLVRLAPGSAPAHAAEDSHAPVAAPPPAVPAAASAGPRVAPPAVFARAPGVPTRPASEPAPPSRPAPERPAPPVVAAPRRAPAPAMAGAGPLRTSRFPLPTPRPPAPARQAAPAFPSRGPGPGAAPAPPAPAPPPRGPVPPPRPRST